MTNRYNRLRSWFLAPIARGPAFLAFLILAGGIAGAINQTNTEADNGRSAIVTSGRAIAIDGCNRDFRTIQELRTILELAAERAKAELAAGEITPANAERAARFYDSRLKALTVPDCRKARDVITDDPRQSTKIPEPLHVDNPETK